MRLYDYNGHRIGVLSGDADQLIDVTDLLDPSVPPPHRMNSLIATWPDLVDRLEEATRIARGGVPLEEVTIGAPQARPPKIIAAPVNYRRHQQEMGGESGVYRGAVVHTIEHYGGFLKASSSIVGPDGAVVLPFPDRRVDHEAELGLVVGRRASRVSRDEALAYVFGYVPLLDITIRGDEDRSWRKSFDTFTPIGPAIVTADEVPDPGNLSFSLTVNGEPRQSANTRDLIFDVPRLVEYYSDAMTLEPGDLIATGTPEGVGPIVPGDEIVLRIDVVGELTMPVRARRTAAADQG